MTIETTAAQGTPNSDTSAQSTAAAATTTAANPAADAATTATQQKPADSTATKPADATATTTAKEGDKPAAKTEGDTKDAPADAAAAKAAKDAADAAAAKPVAPEKYEAFTLPDGVTISPDVEAKVTETAKEFGLPQEGAQKLVNAAIDLQKSFVSQMDTKIAQVRSEWEASSKADKEFGGDNFDVNLAIANTAVRAFGSPAFKQLLKDSGVGSHPEFVRTFLNIGKSISQDQLVNGDSGVPSAEASGFAAAASKLYGGK